jgi:hypothetical protein
LEIAVCEATIVVGSSSTASSLVSTCCAVGSIKNLVDSSVTTLASTRPALARDLLALISAANDCQSKEAIIQ